MGVDVCAVDILGFLGVGAEDAAGAAGRFASDSVSDDVGVAFVCESSRDGVGAVGVEVNAQEGSTLVSSGMVFVCVFELELGAGRVLLFINMSLMLRRRSNSGMSRAESGSKSLFDHCLCRCPPLNMPSGFMISSTWVCSPFRITVSERIANTGQ